MEQIVFYNGQLKDRARYLRNNSSKAEIILWSALKNKALGVRFVRQKMIGNYIVDFYCKELKLVLEVDGISHDGKQLYDENRSAYLHSHNIRVLRILNDDVMRDCDGVIEAIREYVACL